MARKKSQKKKQEFSVFPMQEVLDGQMIYNFIQSNVRFLVFCCVLILFYIGNRYRSDDLIRNITIAQEEITRLRYRSITVSARLMSVSKPSQVFEIVKSKNLGLEFSMEPPKVVK